MDNKITLPREAIIEFKKLYKKHYGVELSDKEAEFRANNLVNLYDAVYGQPSHGSIESTQNTANNLNQEISSPKLYKN